MRGLFSLALSAILLVVVREFVNMTEEKNVFSTNKELPIELCNWHTTSLVGVTTNRRYVRQRGRPKGAKSTEARLKTFYFFLSADIRLLNYVLQSNPFKDPNAWSEIVSNLHNDGFNCSPRQCKDRVRLLINTYQQNSMDNLNKTGSAEEWGVRENLIKSVIAIKESSDGQIITAHIPNSTPHSVISDIINSGEENSQFQQEQDFDNAEEQDFASASLILDDVSSEQSISIIKKRRIDSLNEAMILKTKLDHNLAMAKLRADIEDRNRMRELETRRLELDERRLIMQDEDRKRQAALSELQVKESMAASVREDKRHADTMLLQKTLIEILAKFVSKK